MNLVSMDGDRAARLLEASLCSVLADMVFLDARSLEDREQDPESGGTAGPAVAFRVAIDVLKPTSCRIELGMPDSLRSRIAEILLAGQGEDTLSGGSHDAVLEIVNVIAGQFVVGYFGQGVEIKLELPQLLFGMPDNEGDEVCAFAMDVEGEKLEVRLTSIRYRY